MAARKATSYKEMKQVLKRKAENKVSHDKMLVTVNSVQSDYKIMLDKQISKQTIREYGICQDGYFVKKYPRVFSFQKQGDPDYWGLVMKPELYLKTVFDYSDEKIDSLRSKQEQAMGENHVKS